MLEVIIVFSVAAIIFIILKKAPTDKVKNNLIKKESEGFNLISWRRKTRAFFRSLLENIKNLFSRKRFSKDQERQKKKVKVNITKSFNKAEKLYNQGSLEMAEKVILKLINLKPKKADFYYLLYKIYLKQDNNKDAILALKAAIERKEDGFWLMELAEIYFDQGEFEKAEQAVKEAISLNNTIAYRFKFLAQVQLKLEKKEEGLKNINRALESEPHNKGYQELKAKIENL